MKIWQIALVSTTLGFALPAVAQLATKPEMRSEVEAKVRERMGRFDANNDGIVTREEIMARTDTRMKAHEADEFARMDSNHDGMISRAEFEDYHAKLRGLMRADGMVGDQVSRINNQNMQSPPSDRGFRGDVTMDGNSGDMAMAQGGDRIVVADEVKRAQARFDLMDTNHDGTVTPEERRAYRAMHDGHQTTPSR